ncbi:MAG: hypothetical protein V7651_00630 [Hyphomonas oceanitis]|uniref:Uncharacterized protein n=1 Tax=Hyphomonas oceanitis SCH89 TaxID=1280953 RepID=A0A059GAT2_9PROT|nr:hypothetical protein [Hyphomonas oceanitis]KDA03839.1 hypothetical protein HOC_03148 [Hyphomonas oceanitis SCH89]
MKIEIVKGVREDTLTATRDDGSVARCTFPKKGPIPHDAVHFYVERTFGFRRGFWGMVAGGVSPDDVGAIASAAGHASASKAHMPEEEIVELLQAERLVECFEAEIWGGPAELETLQDVADAGFAQSFVASVPLDQTRVDTVRSGLSDFSAAWMSLKTGHSLTLDWREAG